MSNKILIGYGVLNWNRDERVSDRYGFIHLSEDIDCKNGIHLVHLPQQFGKLVAVVKVNRKSRHIGDFARGISPSMPNVGEMIELGEGKILYRDDEYGLECVGLQPIEERETDWLNPRKLYRAHEQTVDLFFIPYESPENQLTIPLIDKHEETLRRLKNAKLEGL